MLQLFFPIFSRCNDVYSCSRCFIIIMKINEANVATSRAIWKAIRIPTFKNHNLRQTRFRFSLFFFILYLVEIDLVALLRIFIEVNELQYLPQVWASVRWAIPSIGDVLARISSRYAFVSHSRQTACFTCSQREHLFYHFRYPPQASLKLCSRFCCILDELHRQTKAIE